MYFRTMNIDKVKKLYYEEGLSTREVGERIGRTVWQVIKFMRKHNIPRRTTAETQHLQFIRKPLSYKKKKTLNKTERILYSLNILNWFFTHHNIFCL